MINFVCMVWNAVCCKLLSMLVFKILCLQLVFIFKIVNCWTWQCSTDDLCSRVLNRNENRGTYYSTLELCQLVCGSPDHLNIWPRPTGKISSTKDIVIINPEQIEFQIYGKGETSEFLTQVVDYFKQNLKTVGREECTEYSHPMDVTLRTLSDSVSLTLDTDEYYTLQMTLTDDSFRVQIVGNTVFGVRHGVETLLQLILPFRENNKACLASLKFVELSDKPMYAHRGLLLDTARNYLSLKVIKRNIDAMAASKMNVLHWHITDSQSFPLESPSLPNMTRYGAYTEKHIYTPSDIQDLVIYAKLRGIRILMEIDGPSHAGNGWQWGEEAGIGKLAVCINQQPWRSFCIQPPCGQLNPANPNLYKMLHYLFKDIQEKLPYSGMFHMGGDEVFIPCWNSSQEILDYLQGRSLTEETYLNLWAEYQRKALEAYDSAIGHNKTSIVVWTSHLTDPNTIEQYLPKERYIIHAWIPVESEDLITSLVNLGYKLILSTKDRWYLDHGFWGSTNYYNWKMVYDNNISPHESILGGEVCMWGELVDDYNIESRIWPRAAAAAERLWTNPRRRANATERRFFMHRERLVNRGIRAAAEIPNWCIQNEGECITYL